MKTIVTSILKEAVSLIHQEQFTENRLDIGEDILFVLDYSFNKTVKHDEYSEKAYNFVDSIIDRVWERLNTGCWKDVPECLRSIYAFASFLKAINLLKFTLKDNDINIEENLKTSLETIDRGLLLGSSFHSDLTKIASSICGVLHLFSRKHEFDSFNQLINTCPKFTSVPDGKPLISLKCPSIETFSNHYFKLHIPVKLTDCISHWPALRKWQNINYIFEKIGPRLVPVEIGSSYTSSNWSQKLMTVRHFIENYIISNKQKRIGYLAQHQLFNQIPELLDDIREPEYCILSEDYDDPSGTDVNAWFGPGNTVSPLHHDPKHNFLAQVVGSKRVFLVDPALNENVYPFDDHLLFNTSQVDIENPDYDHFPKFKYVNILECRLDPGDMLYIPPKWWHHVRSLSPSFSVSFWWS